MARLISYKGKAGGCRVIIMGGPKTGKTAQIGTLANTFKLLFWDLENGKDVLLNHCTDEQLENIEYISLKDTYSNPCAVHTLLKAYVESNGKGWVCDDHSKWKCPLCTSKSHEFFQIDLPSMTPENGWIHVFDSGTQFALSALQNLCNVNGIKLHNAQADDKVSFSLWKGQGATIDMFLSQLQSSPYHICMTAHEHEVTFQDKSMKLVPAMGTRNYAVNVSKYFDTVIRVSKKMKKHVVESTTASSMNADTGGRRTIDLSLPGNELADFFRPPSEVAHKMQRPEINVTKQAKLQSPSTLVKPATLPEIKLPEPSINLLGMKKS